MYIVLLVLSVISIGALLITWLCLKADEDEVDLYWKSDEKREKEKYKKKRNKKIMIWLSIIILLVDFLGVVLGAHNERESLNKEVESYISAKYTIEQSILNENLSGFEKLELVKLAVEKNQWLASEQYRVKQWYSFYLPKEQILKLEKINLGEE